jgi:hypothetical protein
MAVTNCVRQSSYGYLLTFFHGDSSYQSVPKKRPLFAEVTSTAPESYLGPVVQTIYFPPIYR